LLLVLVILFVPVVIRQIFPPEPPQFERVMLDDSRYSEIAFHNEAQDLDLGGMLFRPTGDGPFPAAVIIHGSGTSRRANGWYLTLTQHLQDNGIAVLLPDKRGSEKSEGDWRASGFQDLATDTLAALAFLRERPDIDAERVGIVGMSQGGWIAPIVANQVHKLAFIVSIVGSSVTPREQLLYEENYNIRQVGFLPGISNLLAYAGSANVRYLAQPDLYKLIVDYDPLPYWRNVTIESLVLLGTDDTNVPSAESARRLRSLANPKIRVTVYRGSGHALESPLGQGNSIIRQDALEAVSDFILDRSTLSAN
jgi:dipeptidyl aminopeptidase/acylaminoacyl peptidase